MIDLADLILKAIVLGSYQTNCYLIIDKISGASALIDPGFYTPSLEKLLADNGVDKLDYILLTHGHLDHTCGAAYVQKKYGGKIVIGEEDAYTLGVYKFSEDTPDYKGAFTACEADILLTDETELPFGSKTIKIMYTPGHTLGEVCYIIDNLFFVGDVIFRDAIGRTDLEGGNIFTMIKTLKKICAIEEDYMVFPGHGEYTTLSYEKKYNRFLSPIVRK